MPRKLTADKAYFTALAPVLSAFFRFLHEEGLLPSAELLAKKIEQLGPEIVVNGANPAMWGMGKTFAMKAKAAWVDFPPFHPVGHADLYACPLAWMRPTRM